MYQNALKELLEALQDPSKHSLLRLRIRNGFLALGEPFDIEEATEVDHSLDTLAIRTLASHITSGGIGTYHAKMAITSYQTGEESSVRIIATDSEEVAEFIDDFIAENAATNSEEEFDEIPEKEVEVDPFDIN